MSDTILRYFVIFCNFLVSLNKSKLSDDHVFILTNFLSSMLFREDLQ